MGHAKERDRGVVTRPQDVLSQSSNTAPSPGSRAQAQPSNEIDRSPSLPDDHSPSSPSSTQKADRVKAKMGQPEPVRPLPDPPPRNHNQRGGEGGPDTQDADSTFEFDGWESLVGDTEQGEQGERFEGLPTYEQSVGPELAGAEDEGFGEEGGGDEAEGGSGGGGALGRFGRWRGWVEKRAHERFTDDDGAGEERRATRRAVPSAASDQPLPPSYSPAATGTGTATGGTQASNDEETSIPRAARSTSLGEFLRLDYGSRVIPHSSGRITSVLPLFQGRLILFGSTDGLRVVNTDMTEKVVRVLWTGLAVWGMTILSSSSSSSVTQHLGEGEGDGGTVDKTPHGSIVLHCGGEEAGSGSGSSAGPKKGTGSEVRVYALQSLVSLARWAAVQPFTFRGIDMSPSAQNGKGGPDAKGKGKEKEKDKMRRDWDIDGPSLSISASLSPIPGERSSSLPAQSERSSAVMGTGMGMSDLAQAWAKDYTLLPTNPSSLAAAAAATSRTKQPDALGISTYTHSASARVYVVITTTTHIIVHAGLLQPPSPSPSSNGIGGVSGRGSHSERSRGQGGAVEFRGWKILSLPSAPRHTAFLRLSTGRAIRSPLSSPRVLSTLDPPQSHSHRNTTSTSAPFPGSASFVPPRPSSAFEAHIEPAAAGERNGISMTEHADRPQEQIQNEEDATPSLGLYVTFGSKACLIRISDSSVLDLKVMQDTKGDWGPMCRLCLPGGGGEVYGLNRGKETWLFSSPFLLPASTNKPITRLLWPESPSTISASLVHPFPPSLSSSPAPANTTPSDPRGDLTIRLASTSPSGNLHIRYLPFASGATNANRNAGAGAGSGPGGAKPFVSYKIGAQARLLAVDVIDVEVGVQGPLEDGDHIFLGYSVSAVHRDWRVVKLQRQRHRQRQRS